MFEKKVTDPDYALVIENLIMASHEDFETWSTLCVGFNESKNLLIRLDYFNDNNPKNNSQTYAVIDKDNAFQMSGFLGIKLIELPDFLYEKFKDTSTMAVPSDVQYLFQRILDFVMDCGVNYKIVTL